MTCMDISAARMDALATKVAQKVGGQIEKLVFREGDFSNVLPFSDGSFDLVLFDAALHHSRNIWLTLQECHRVLSNDGILVAQREAFVALLTSGIAFRRLLCSPEVAAGVSENAYLRSQYDYYMRANGFLPTFRSVAPGRWALVGFLNGWVFSKWAIVAQRREHAPVLE